MVSRRLPARSVVTLRLSPLAAALAACWPLLAVGAPKAPAPSAVPIPSASWRVYGNGSAAPVNTPNGQGGIDQKIRQDSQRAIYQWQSFDIGANSSVTFDMALKNSSALNRVLGSTAPSQIFGKLSATNGGEIYLINANGILFGRGAQVNTGSLVASALNLSDEEFLSGLTNSLLHDKTRPAFAYDGTPERFVDSRNFVRVDEGATITTTNGGRVFLFAKRVENAGQISTPGGQTMLAAGGRVYLQAPSDQITLYASEANPEVPTLRGLLVEVGSGPAGAPEGQHGSVVNEATGRIDTPRGNATLVAMAVNQMGRISATTSVTENGSIILRAQGNARVLNEGVRATQAGALVLGAGSQTTIAPDSGADVNGGKPLTSDGNATFVNPRIDLAGGSVLLDSGAQVIAPGATVDVRAERTPNYAAHDNRVFEGEGARDDSRIVLADDAGIDVSGTTTAVESVERYFVTTGLLGSNDLKDAPLQKDGLLYRSKATIDVRGDSSILGSLESYRDGLQQTIEERLSAGGQVRLTAGGGVLTHADSRIDVSGGQVTLTAAQVRETQLIGTDGRVYDLNDAPADQRYTSALNLQSSGAAGFDRWGVKVNYGQLTPTHHEEGYVEGRAAGSVSIVAPTALLQGRLDAHVTEGTRQQRGDDGQPARGRLTVGAVTQGGQDFTHGNHSGDAVLRHFHVSTLGPQVDEAEQKQLWADAMAASLPKASGMRLDTLVDAGFGEIAIAVNGQVSMLAQTADASLALGDQASLRLLSSQGDVTLGGQLRSAGGSVEMNARLGHATLVEGAGVHLQGAFVNVLRDGPRRTTATAGGSFSASGLTGVSLGAASVVDVSGGASVDAGGQLTGADAGTIALAHTAQAPDDAAGIVMGGVLRGEALGTGGTLSLTAPEVRIGGTQAPAGVQHIDPALLQQGGFSSFVIDGRRELQVAADTAVQLQRDEWVADRRAAALAASGSDWRDFASTGPAPGVAPAALSLALKASGTDAGNGRLTVHQGALIEGPARSNISLSAQNQLLMGGTIHSAGGQVALSLDARSPALGGAPDTMLWIGEHARIDVSGTAVPEPTTNGLRQGQVLDGGRITLAAKGSAGTEPVLVMQQGAELVARGASATLDRAELGEGGVRWSRERVDSNGGSLSIEANRALVTEASIDLRGGGSRGAGGTLAVKLTAEPTADPGTPENARRDLRIAEGPTEKTAGLAMGDTAGIAELTDTASISASTIRASGAAHLSLGARDALRFLDGVELELAGTLTLASRTIGVQPGQSSRLEAGQVQLQGVRVPAGVAAPSPRAQAGDATLEIHSRDGLAVSGDWVTQGLAQLSLAAEGDLMLHGVEASTPRGSLTTAGDLTLRARQVYPGTATEFRIDASGHDVTIAGHGTDASRIESPLSAGGRLTIAAATITQGGVVRAPQGQIVLAATESVSLAEGSTTSVSADGLVLPYGTSAPSRWTAPDGSTLEAAPTKRIDIESPTVNLAEGATVDLKGGGDLVAYEFVAGRGGSTDVFAGGNGAYALVPSVQGAALYDPTLAGAASQGRQIEIGPGGPVPAGTYTLLPARYALQPGAFLVEPVKAATPLAMGAAVTQADGSVWVGARLSTAGTGLADAQASTWRVSTRAQARTRSEIRETSANAEFAARAAQQGQVAPERPVDAGTLSLATTDARIEASIAMAGAKEGGRGGRAEFTAAEVVVGSAGSGAAEGTLQLDVATLNQLGARTLVLGARSGTRSEDGSDGGSTALEVGARSVTVATEGQALNVSDLVLAAREEVRVASGSVLTSGTSSAAPAAYTIEGDGAALRLSGAPGASLRREGATMASGSLAVESGVRLDAGDGSLVLDASRDTQVAGSSRLVASEMTLGAPTITVGGPVGGPGVLALTPALLEKVSSADQLTLHAYRFVNLKDGAVLGEDAAGTPTLKRLVLDTPALRATEATGEGARITAGEITLVNSSGATGGPAREGDGRITLHASQAAGGSGDIRFGGGRVVVRDSAELSLQADNAIALASREGGLASGGDVTLHSRGVVAESAGAGGSVEAGGEVRINALSGTVAPPSALGSSFHVEAQSIRHDGRIVLPSGEVVLDARDEVVLGEGSRIDVSGRTVAVGEASVDLGGGQVELVAQSGDLQLQGGVVDVSAAGRAAGGRLALTATQGAVQIGSQLRGTSAGTGAEVSIDSGAPVDLAALARHLHESDPASFSGAIRVHQRQGDLQVGPQTTLAAREIELSTDGGALTVRGTLDARGSEGGRIALASRDGLELASGAALLASAAAGGASGGRVELSAAQGSLQLQAGSRIDVSGGDASQGGAEGEAGRLTLRAQRLGVTADNPGGAGVDIGALHGEIAGAGRIDVEAVKVYDGITRLTDFAFPAEGTLLTSTLASEGRAFVGVEGGKAALLAERLAGGNQALQSLIRIHAAAEIRSDGDLEVDMLAGSWSTPTERSDIRLSGGEAGAVGDSSITLRAAGDLTVRSSIDAGFHWSGRSDAGGALRFVAGADLGAALATAVQRGSGADLVIGRDDPRPQDVRIRTTTGDITLAAAGDVDLVKGRARAFSTGVAVEDAAADAARRQLFQPDAFRAGGGDIRIEAGDSVRSRSVVLDSFAVYYNETHLLGAHPNGWSRIQKTGELVHWDARPDDFAAGLQHGVGTFGGGRIDVKAGTDVKGLIAAAPSSGFLDAEGAAHAYGGGSVRVSAGRDVVGGIVQAGGRTLDVRAGRDVAWAENTALTEAGATTPGLLLAHENTEAQVSARRDLTLGADVSSHALSGRWVSGLERDASLTVRAAGGDLVYRADAEPDTWENTAGDTLTVNLLPTQVTMAAPSGSLTMGGIHGAAPVVQQAEGPQARLELLARHDLAVRTDLQLNASWSQGVGYHDDSGPDFLSPGGQGLPGSAWLALGYGDLARGDGTGLDRSDRTPARLVAAEGDIELQGSLRSARPLRVLAAGDIALTGTNVNSGIEVQQQGMRLDGAGEVPLSELTLLQAGRDITLGQAALRIAGPGDLVLLAGRDLDLGRGAGVQSVGNIDNGTRLPEGSAGVTLLAGLRADGADYAEATRRGYAVLGHGALARRSADLYAWLQAGEGPRPVLDSAEAKAFAALDTDAQLGRVRSLLGDAAYDAGIVRYVRGLVGHERDSAEQALKAFATLSTVKRAAAPGALLAGALGDEDAATRQAFVASVARADAPKQAQALQAFVLQQTGESMPLEAALAAFEALPLERQLLRLNAVLIDELRTHGRAAVAARIAEEKEAAYDRGYAAINALFPVDDAGRPAGEIRLPTTQARTLQGSGLTLLAPGSDINAGETGSSSKKPSELGIVTVAGGDIAGVARGDILVNQSRIFTLAEGDILLWSSAGDVDAGRGAKTVVGAPAPVFRLDANGRIVVDTSGSFSGSGIAVLDADSALDLYAPAGAIDAGEAGIRALGTVTLGAEVVRGADDIVGGSVAGAPPAAPTVGATAALAQATDAAASATRGTDDDEEERRRKRRARRQLLLEFLGFGQG